MAFGVGRFWISISGGGTATDEEIALISRVKYRFQREMNPLFIFNLTAAMGDQETGSLYRHPLIPAIDTLKDNHLFSSANACDALQGLVTPIHFEKALLWEEFRCQRRFKLPSHFFQTPPYMHPNGKSFAALAFNTGRRQFLDPLWVKKNVKFFHLFEYSKLLKYKDKLPHFFNVFSTFSKEELLNILEGEGTIYGGKFILARLKYSIPFEVLEYRVYRRLDMNFFLSQTPFNVLSFKKGMTCAYRDKNLCWKYKLSHAFKLANKRSVILLIGSLFLTITLMLLLLRRIKKGKLEGARKRLALQVLTHEFRTPVTSLMLVMENLQNRMSDIPKDVQESLLQAQSDVYRLQRLTQMSKHYLNLEGGQKLVVTRTLLLSSVNDFMQDIYDDVCNQYKMQDRDTDLSFLRSNNDCSFHGDPYWLGVVLKNLISNSFNHGKPPILLSVVVQKETILLHVDDCGDCSFSTLGQMTKEFVKGNKSSGTGLGLNIVKAAVKDMGGKLLFEKRIGGSRFSIELNKGSQDE